MLPETLVGITPLQVSAAVLLGGAIGFLAWACQRQDGSASESKVSSFFMGMLGPLAPLLVRKERDDDLDDDEDEEDYLRMLRTFFPLIVLAAMVVAAMTTHWPQIH
ncbi:MAG: hypothetical protein ACM30I_15665 [Gemmatimonas sp.]